MGFWVLVSLHLNVFVSSVVRVGEEGLALYLLVMVVGDLTYFVGGHGRGGFNILLYLGGMD